MPPTNLRQRRQPRSSPMRLVAPALIVFSLGTPSVMANTGSLPLRSTVNDRLDSGPSVASDASSFQQNKRMSTPKEQSASDALNRRKHVTFQDLDQLQGSSGLDRSRSRVLPLDQLKSNTLAALLYQDVSTNDLDAVIYDSDSNADAHQAPSLETDSRVLAAPPASRQNPAQNPAGRSRAAYNQDLVGKQTGNGYVFSLHREPDLSISNAGAALLNLFTRRDSPVSRPPLVPNSNSRLLIVLVVVCVIGVGILTLAAQHTWRWLQAAIQPRSLLRRRSGDGRPTRTLHRSNGSYTSLHTSSLLVPSFDEEEERIKTPPTLSRRSSAAATAAAAAAAAASSTGPHHDMGSDSDDDASERKASHDLHYLALPFGIGIGYSYANIADGGDARTRISRLAAKRSRRRLGSTVALSTGALPIAGTRAVSGADGLRSRSRSFKELCRDAFGTTTSRDIGMISEEEADDDMTTVPTTRWGSSLISLDLSGSERGSGTVTPTGPSAAGILPSTVSSSIALEDLISTPSSKGRFFGADNPAAAAASGHTLIDLGLGSADVADSHPEGITPGVDAGRVMPSQVARHPQVEHLRREGRSETGKRVGKGTPTNAKLH
ncbi:hypothetical protein EX895_004949 [Sporisorium graminicola]|uniref:Uncharacterized protein n=1 Tax=Sporisorium graminicola TaxID=280036 RepID=A0A4U7KP77_9BASI|nr:hypothetical protein EX895_004949 [Sporisorium graminicola]TKY86124.1 hypothetical protein EX895_004949 [Sporisorium graminicola]